MELTFTAERIKKGGAGKITCENGEQSLSIRKIGSSDIPDKGYGSPEIKVDPVTGAMNLSGVIVLKRGEPWSESIIEWVMGKEISPGELYVDGLEMEGIYWPDKTNMPDVFSTLRHPEPR